MGESGGLSAPDVNSAGHHGDVRDPNRAPSRWSPQPSCRLTYRTVRYARWLFYVCGTSLWQ